jgi:hypothetical protein
MATYDKGDLVRMAATWKNQAGANVDPTTVKLIVRAPSGATTTYAFGVDSIIKQEVGVYSFELVATTPGPFVYRWEGTGTATASGQSQFFVEDRLF